MNKKVITTSLMAIVLFACGGESKEEGGATDSTKTEETTEVPENTEAAEIPEAETADETQDLNSTPLKVIETIANAAKTREYEPLKQLLHESVKADRDCREVCGMAEHKDEDARFVEFFSEMVVDGEPKIEGDKAEVKVKVGKGASKNETIKMVQVDGKWYLESF